MIWLSLYLARNLNSRDGKIGPLHRSNELGEPVLFERGRDEHEGEGEAGADGRQPDDGLDEAAGGQVGDAVAAERAEEAGQVGAGLTGGGAGAAVLEGNILGYTIIVLDVLLVMCLLLIWC